MFNGEISVFLIYRHMYFAVVHRRDTSFPYIQTRLPRFCTSARYQSSLYTDAPTSPLNIGEISVFLSYIQTHVLHRCTSARYQSSLYTDAPTPPLYIGETPTFVIYSDAPTSPLNIGEISVFLIYRRMYFAVEHRRDISLSFLYTNVCTSPLYIGEISVFRMYFAVVHRPDISHPYIQTHLPRRCTSARYQSSLYTDAPTSPLNIGEISVFLICRHMYFAVVHRRDISLPHIQTHLSTSPMFNGEISVFLIYIDTCTSPLYIGEEVVLYYITC